MQRALLLLNEALRIKADLAEAYGNRGRLKMYLGNIEEAKTDFLTALELAEGKSKKSQS